VINWYKKVLADRGTPRAWDLDEKSRDPYKSSPKVDPAGWHNLGGNERAGYPQGTQAVKDEEDPQNIRNIEDESHSLFIDQEEGFGQGSGYSKQEPFSSEEDKLYKMDEVPEPIGPHNMTNSAPSTQKRLKNNDVYNLVSRNAPLSYVRNI